MLRKVIIFIFYTLFTTALCAKEPLLATLNTTLSNGVQRFGIGSYTFECRTYGAITLETLYNKSQKNSACQKSIDKFYKKNIKLKYYASDILESNQQYHVEIKDRECIIYAKGQISLSELLIQNGLAIKNPKFNDEEFNSYFTLAQLKAKKQKKGLWGENIFKSCVKELY